MFDLQGYYFDSGLHYVVPWSEHLLQVITGASTECIYQSVIVFLHEIFFRFSSNFDLQNSHTQIYTHKSINREKNQKNNIRMQCCNRLEYLCTILGFQTF